MYESDWTCTRRFSDGFVTISSEGSRIRGRNVWKRFQHIASTIILVINNHVMTWLRLNPRRWFIHSATFDCSWKMLATNYLPLFRIGEHYFLKENIVQLYLKVSKIFQAIRRRCIVFQGTRTSSESQTYPHTKSPFPPSRDALQRGDRSSRTNSKHSIRASHTEVEWWCFEEGYSCSLTLMSTSAVRLSLGRSILVDEHGE